MDRDPIALAGPETDSEGPLLSYSIGRLDRAVRHRLRQILLPYELTIPQFTTLSVLKRRPGLSNAQLARRALILPQSMIQVISALEERQLVRRAPDPAHQRVLCAHLTRSGRRVVEDAERATRSFEDELARAAGGRREAAEVAGVLQRWFAVCAEETGCGRMTEETL